MVLFQYCDCVHDISFKFFSIIFLQLISADYMQIKIILIKKNALKSSSQKPLNQIGLGCSLVFCILSLPLMSLIRLISMQVLSKEEFEDTKEIIRICKSKNRQHNGQKKKNKRRNNDRQRIHIKLKIM